MEHYIRIPLSGYCKVDNATKVIEALFYDDEKWGKEFIRLECYMVKQALNMED